MLAEYLWSLRLKLELEQYFFYICNKAKFFLLSNTVESNLKPGAAKRIWKWVGQNVYWLRKPHHGWGWRARKFLKNWSLRLVKTHSKFNNYFPIILTRLKIKASNTKKIDELIGNIFHFKGVNQRTMYQNKAKTYPD